MIGIPGVSWRFWKRQRIATISARPGFFWVQLCLPLKSMVARDTPSLFRWIVLKTEVEMTMTQTGLSIRYMWILLMIANKSQWLKLKPRVVRSYQHYETVSSSTIIWDTILFIAWCWAALSFWYYLYTCPSKNLLPSHYFKPSALLSERVKTH